MMRPHSLWLWLASVPLFWGCPSAPPPKAPRPPAAASAFASQQETARRILDAALAQNNAYEHLAQLCDDIGHRLSGSVGLTRAVAWAQATLTADGHEDVRAEPVTVRRWVRGAESLTLLSPREAPIAMLGLGNSVGTPREGITAEVVVARDEAELDALGEAVKGKILLFNNPMPPYSEEKGTGYGEAARFRFGGPRIAAERGAVAVLVRSVTAYSLRSPHTGATGYRGLDPKLPKLPAAAVSVEDAELLDRLYRKGARPTVRLLMEARDEGEVPSANVVAELRGREKPEEIVLLGAHLDSWDVGQGAHDDGAGVVIVMEAISVLRRLGIQPKRTIRVVLFTNEENGLAGGREYAKAHADELSRHVVAIEADIGGFRPVGLSVEFPEGTPEATQAEGAARARDLLSLVEPLGPQRVEVGGSGADIGPMQGKGPLLFGFEVDPARYFDYHHSQADTLDKVDPKELSQCVASMAVIAYLFAEAW